MKVEVREEDGKATKVRVTVGVARFDLTEQFGRLNILVTGKLRVLPAASNAIELEAEQD